MKKWLIVLFSLIVIFSTISIHSTYAYFSIGNVNSVSSKVTVSKWIDYPMWNKDNVYQKGIIIYWNDELYVAKRNVPAKKEPGKLGSQNFWEYFEVI